VDEQAMNEEKQTRMKSYALLAKRKQAIYLFLTPLELSSFVSISKKSLGKFTQIAACQ
jgi:hypothetical protein